jgi:CRISPR-associated protein Csm4
MRGKGEGIEAARTAKEAGEVAWLALEEFGQAIQGVQAVPRQVEKGKLPVTQVTLKNQISRITGTTGEEGNLFDFAEVFCSAVSIYVKVAEGFVEDAERLFSFIARQGYGKRKSVGYGEIDFQSFTFEPFPGFGSPAEANGFVSLSNFVPARDDPTRGAWRTMVKYGKLGEEYALHEHPFKRPLIMLVAGSSFYDQPPRGYYGRLVEDVSASHPEVVQYGLAFAVPARLPEEVFP